MDARMVRIGFTGMARAATSASGAAQRPMDQVVRIPRRAAMRSDDYGPLAEQIARDANCFLCTSIFVRDGLDKIFS